MKITRTLQPIVTVATILTSGIMGATASATPNTSSYSMQLSGNTVSVYETSSEAVNTVEADFTYTDSQNALQSVSETAGSTFTTCTSNTSSSVVCTALGGAITGTHLVAQLTLNLKAGLSSANVTVGMAGSSMILSSTDNTDTLNHSALPVASYHYTAPVTTPPSNPSTGGSTGASSSAPSSSTTGTKSTTTSKPQPTTGSTSQTSTSTSSTTTQSQKNTKHEVSNSRHIKSHHAGVVTSALALVVVAAGAYWLVIRKRTEVAPVKTTYKLDTASKSKTTNKSKKTTAKKKA
ncbi:MAG TPA: hypothetical protein VLG92_01885 [Candidatus Saccharimonadia bacterium]|nr:hypothetical protein [Candidatus Saccharimonadia bacterium]